MLVGAVTLLLVNNVETYTLTMCYARNACADDCHSWATLNNMIEWGYCNETACTNVYQHVGDNKCDDVIGSYLNHSLVLRAYANQGNDRRYCLLYDVIDGAFKFRISCEY